MLEVQTPHGPARVRLQQPPTPARRAVVLGHGAGGGIGATDLRATAETALELGYAVALVEQPYRVAGRRSPPPARPLDTAWLAVMAALTDGPLAGCAIVAGVRCWAVLNPTLPDDRVRELESDRDSQVARLAGWRIGAAELV